MCRRLESVFLSVRKGDENVLSKIRKVFFVFLVLPVFFCFGKTASATSETNVIEDVAQDVAQDVTEHTNFLIKWLLDQREPALDFVKKLILILIVYLIGKWIIRLLLKLIDKMMKKREMDLAVQNFVHSFSKVAFFFLLIFIIAGMLGIGATAVAVVGSAGLAIGLALQGSLSNLAGGILVLAVKPFTIGDYIVTTGVEGTVQGIDIFYTRIKTLDNKVIMIPNGSIMGSDITNVTKEPVRMLQIDFFVDFDTDMDELKDEIMYIMKEEVLLVQDSPMETVILKLGVKKIQLQARAWAKTENYWAANESVSEKIKKRIASRI